MTDLDKANKAKRVVAHAILVTLCVIFFGIALYASVNQLFPFAEFVSIFLCAVFGYLSWFFEGGDE